MGNESITIVNLFFPQGTKYQNGHFVPYCILVIPDMLWPGSPSLFQQAPRHCYQIDLLTRFPVPFVESRKDRSTKSTESLGFHF